MAEPDASGKIPGLISLFISVLAFLRPNIEAAYKRYFKKTSVNVICLNQAEIGFNTTGSYIICALTFIAKDGDAIVLNATCEVTNLKSNQKISQSSFMFISNEFPAGPALYAKPIVVANGSTITNQIQFSNWDNLQRIKTLVGKFGHGLTAPTTKLEPDQLEAFLMSAHQAESFKTVNEIDHLRFWEPGEYQMKVHIECQGECISNTPMFTFEVNSDFVEDLKQNKFGIISSSLGVAAFFRSDTVSMTPVA
jgi:hypothetical protein